MQFDEMVTYTQEATQYSHVLKDEFERRSILDNKENKKAYVNDPTTIYKRKYDYVTRAKEVELAAQRAGLVPYNGELERADQEQIAHEPELGKEQKKALEMEKAAQIHEAEMVNMRRSRIRQVTFIDKGRLKKGTLYKIKSNEVEEEIKLHNEKLEVIEQSLKGALEDKNLTDERKLLIKIEAMKDRIKEYNDFGHLFPVEAKERIEALSKKEELGLQLRDLRKDLEIMRLEKTSPKEADKAKSSRKTHGFYDLFRSVFHSKHSAFHPDMSLSKEDAVYHDEKGKKVFINKGRAFFGGTKPMYFYKESGENGKDWLYKEAVDCLGNKTPERAYITEGSSKLQQRLCGDNNFIPVFVAKNAQGKAIGTFQEQVTTNDTPTVNLFEWQKKVQASKDSGKPEDAPEPLEAEVINQVLREHTLDWVICNFDTKGENFLQKEDKSLVSIDKEAAFSKIDKEGAQTMSRTVKLHKNDTIYNVIFSQFVERDPEKVPMNINFDTIEQSLIKLSEISDEEYLAMFDGFLTLKFGKDSPQNEKRHAFERKMLNRKNGTKAEYERFIGSLLKERYEKLQASNSTAAIRDFKDHYNGLYVIENDGKWLYRFPTDRDGNPNQG